MGLFDGTPLEQAIICERCGEDVKVCDCPPELEKKTEEPFIPPEKQRLKVRAEKRKRGKWMTVVAGFRGPAAQLQEVFTQLKNNCGAGGTIEGQQIEIQGDQVEKVRNVLQRLGFRV